MRKFIINVISDLLIALVILFAISWYDSSKLTRADYRLPNNITKIVLGPSTSGCAIDDSLTPGLKNMSRNGTNIFLTLPQLPDILDQNPQIDTVYIAYGRFPYHTGQEDFVTLGIDRITGLRDYMLYPYRSDNNVLKSLLMNPNFYIVMANPDILALIHNRPNIEEMSLGFTNIGDRQNLHKAGAIWGIDEYKQWAAKHNNGVLTPEYIEKQMGYANKYLLQGIQTCKDRNVVPVLFFTPLYQYSRFVKWDNIVDAMKIFGDDILIADYEDFIFPDPSYYGDVHHLNLKGARYFSEYIAKHGIKCKPQFEWRKGIETSQDEN